MTPPERWRVFQCYCCPPSVSRTLLKVHQWACSRSEKTLWVHLFDDCTIDTEIPGAGRMVVQERTNYPWDGKVTFTIQQPANAALKLRIPGWAAAASAKVNGEVLSPMPGDYLTIEREWKAGDTVEIDLPMPVRMIRSNFRVDENRGKVAIMRGPLVYCLETPDLPKGVSPLDVALDRTAGFDVQHADAPLGGYSVIRTSGVKLAAMDNDDNLYATYSVGAEQGLALTLVPYFAWNNRGLAEMTVWMPLA